MTEQGPTSGGARGPTNVKLLIDAVVQKTMVLVAQLATSDGARAPLAHIADQVFLELIAELENQGVRKKVVADMFGLALRSYQKRVQRLAESRSVPGASLWEAMLAHLAPRPGETDRVVPRGEILARFKYDDEASVRGILRDLVESGLVFETGGGAAPAYRAVTARELGALQRAEASEGLGALVWLTVYQHGPVTREALGERLRHVATADLARALAALADDGRVHEAANDTFVSRHFLPDAQARGWEASVSDHFEAVITTLCRALRKDPSDPRAKLAGGSTYTFDVWAGHPYEAEVLGLLARLRAETSALRARVTAHNEAHVPPDETLRVTFYGGLSYVPRATQDDPERADAASAAPPVLPPLAQSESSDAQESKTR